MSCKREWKAYKDPELYVNGQPTDKQLYLSALHKYSGDEEQARARVNRVLNMEKMYSHMINRPDKD